jgi:pre-rRNA-processing protein IPI1
MVSKKKREKAKDFAKTKLKVGKTAAKPANYTDTSFVAKTISLPNQTLSRNIDSEADLIKRLTLVKHHSNNTRKETLMFIQQHLPDNPSSYKQILNAIVPLILDQSQSVRVALQELLITASEKQPNLMELHARSIILFIHSAMTHINGPIRNDACKFLDVLIKYGPDSLVRSSWVKTLKSYFTVLNWTLNDTKQSVSFAVTTSNINTNSSKAKKVAVESLVKFIRVGAFPKDEETQAKEIICSSAMTSKYLFPTTPQPFAHLKLFTRELTATSGESSANNTAIDLNASCEDYETRRKILKEFFLPQMGKQLVNLVKEGGDLGKAAKSLENLITELSSESEL